MKTSLDYKKLYKLAKLYLTKYRVPLTVLVIAGVFAFAFMRINQLSDPKADEEYLIETLSTYKEVSIDEETVENIRKLIESDVEINPQFNNRNNPFAE